MAKPGLWPLAAWVKVQILFTLLQSQWKWINIRVTEVGMATTAPGEGLGLDPEMG